MVKLFLLYAILIFAKRAPKLIEDLLKLKGDGIGLKGLNIKNKLGEAALVGDKVKKGLTKAEGAVRGATRGAISGATTSIKMGAAKGFKDKFRESQKNGDGFGRSTLEGLKEGFKGGFNKDTLKTAGRGAISGGLGGAKAAENAKDGNLRGIGKNAAKEVEQVVRGGNLSLKDKLKLQGQGVMENIASHGIGSLEIARSNEAKAARDKYNKLIGSKQTDKITDVINALTGADKFNDDASHQAYMKTQKSIAETTDGSYTVYRVSRDEHGNAKLDSNGQFIYDEIKVDKNGAFSYSSTIASEISPITSSFEPGAAKIEFTEHNGSDKLLLKKNIYDAREKVLSEMQQKYSELIQIDGMKMENIGPELEKIYEKNKALFTANAGNDSSLELNIGAITFTDITGATIGEDEKYHYDGVNSFELSKVVTTNSKAKSANDSEISKRDEIEQRKAAGQATTNDDKK